MDFGNDHNYFNTYIQKGLCLTWFPKCLKLLVVMCKEGLKDGIGLTGQG